MSSAETTESNAPVTALVIPERDDKGRFPKGVSGNPLGRPKGRHLADLKMDLEIAVRDNISPARIVKILNKMADMAENGSVAAAKLILDKTISNASAGEDGASSGERFVIFRVENVTIQRDKPTPKQVEAVIDVKSEVIPSG